jgi:hypothetical protein
MIRYDSFPYSSLLFCLPILDVWFVKGHWLWKGALVALVFSSYYCNLYPDKYALVVWDHSVIVLLGVAYMYSIQSVYWVYGITILYVYELWRYKIHLSKIISFTVLNLYTMSSLSYIHMFPCMYILASALYFYYTRHVYHASYPLKTLFWHSGCTLLLGYATMTLRS